MRWRRPPSRRARFVPSRESLYVLPLPHRPLITFALFVVGQVSAGIEELARQGEDLPRVPDYIIVLRPSRAARLSLRRLLLLLLPYATPPLRLWSPLGGSDSDLAGPLSSAGSSPVTRNSRRGLAPNRSSRISPRASLWR